MRQDILDSIARMNADDIQDVATTFGMFNTCPRPSCKKTSKQIIKEAALADEDIAEYVLNY